MGFITLYYISFMLCLRLVLTTSWQKSYLWLCLCFGKSEWAMLWLLHFLKLIDFQQLTNKQLNLKLLMAFNRLWDYFWWCTVHKQHRRLTKTPWRVHWSFSPSPKLPTLCHDYPCWLFNFLGSQLIYFWRHFWENDNSTLGRPKSSHSSKPYKPEFFS